MLVLVRVLATGPQLGQFLCSLVNEGYGIAVACGSDGEDTLYMALTGVGWNPVRSGAAREHRGRVALRARMCVRTCACVFVCVFARVRLCVLVCARVCVAACVRACVRACACVRVLGARRLPPQREHGVVLRLNPRTHCRHIPGKHTRLVLSSRPGSCVLAHVAAQVSNTAMAGTTPPTAQALLQRLQGASKTLRNLATAAAPQRTGPSEPTRDRRRE